ncbi:MAG: deaminase [Actinobacteria bacterium]|nr:deaminase [Actinomycetota bacterium]
MEQLVPAPLAAPLATTLRDDDRSQTARPWVLANMVGSVDGAYARGGRSGGLSSEADRELFHILRSLADVVLVGAATARAERYRRPVDAGDSKARLAVVSKSLNIPSDQPFLSGSGPDPLVYFPQGADASSLPSGVEPCELDSEVVRPSDVLADLYRRGARTVLCEGGPNLLGQIAGAGLLDELFWTIAPVLEGGSLVGLVGTGGPYGTELRLHRLLRDGEVLFATYRAVRADD